MCLAFFAVLAVMPGSFIMQKNVYRQLPLFRFLERKAARDFQRKDPDTYAKIVENHTEYLGAMVEKENEEVRKEQEKVVGQAQKEAAGKNSCFIRRCLSGSVCCRWRYASSFIP